MNLSFVCDYFLESHRRTDAIPTTKLRQIARGRCSAGIGTFVKNERVMEAVQHYFKTIERGNQQLTIDLPDGIDKAEIEVIVRPLHVEVSVKPSRLEAIQKFKGIFMDSTYQVDDYDVYDQ